MKRLLFLCFILVAIAIISSLKSIRSEDAIVSSILATPRQKTIVVKSMKELRKVSPLTKIDLCDLSHQGLTRMPDLSMYRIKHLVLAYNDIKVFDYRNLPKEIEYLDMKYTKIGHSYQVRDSKKIRTFSMNSIHIGETKLKEFDCSHNAVEIIFIPTTLIRLNASHNRLKEIMVCLPQPPKKKPTDIKSGGHYTVENSLRYLNVSHNPDFDSIQRFNIETIDTIISTNAARGAKIRKAKGRFIFYFREESQ